MIRKRYQEFINEEVGFRNLRELAKKYRTAEIYFHQDLDGVCSALAMKHFIERYYGIKVVDTHIIQYGGLEYAVKHTRPDNLPIIVDYAHSKVGYILFDHHDKQRTRIASRGSGSCAGRHGKQQPHAHVPKCCAVYEDDGGSLLDNGRTTQKSNDGNVGTQHNHWFSGILERTKMEQ
jgi:hypothetical protein